MIVVRRSSVGEITLGDIIVFNVDIDGISGVARRAIQVFDDGGKIGIRTKGDNVESVDSLIVHEEDLVGKVVSSRPMLIWSRSATVSKCHTYGEWALHVSVHAIRLEN